MRRYLLGLLLGACLGITTALFCTTPLGLAFEEDVGLEWLFRLRGPLPPPAGVAVVAIDKRSAIELQLSEKPRDWPRSLHGRLIEALVARGAEVIVFDLTFERPQAGQEDAAFARAIAGSDRVLLVESIEQNCPRGEDGKAAVACWQEVRRPVPILAEAAWGVAPFPLPREVSSRVDTFWAFVDAMDDRLTLPALALHARALRRDQSWERMFYEASQGIVGRTITLDALTHALRRTGRAGQAVDPLLPGGEIGSSARFESDERLALRAAIRRLYTGPDSHVLNFYGPPGPSGTSPTPG